MVGTSATFFIGLSVFIAIAGWFMAHPLLAAMGTFINARLVMRLGMRRIARSAYAMQIVSSTLALILVGIPAVLRFHEECLKSLTEPEPGSE